MHGRQRAADTRRAGKFFWIACNSYAKKPPADIAGVESSRVRTGMLVADFFPARAAVGGPEIRN
jgi:hypothetical protein